MSDRINDFLDKICASVKYRTMHSEIREEFKNHIDEASRSGGEYVAFKIG